jgi:uncharacterized membrane protein
VKAEPTSGALRTIATVLAIAGTTVLLDMLWLGLIARQFYDSSLAPLKRSTAYLPAAGLFYCFYVAVILTYAVRGSNSRMAATRRGAALGLVVYATYELTNWAVLRDWPGALVPVDIGWGVVLTAAAATVGKWTSDKLQAGRPASPVA